MLEADEIARTHRRCVDIEDVLERQLDAFDRRAIAFQMSELKMRASSKSFDRAIRAR